MRAKQLAEETGVSGRVAITEKEEREAENNMKKLQDVRLQFGLLYIMGDNICKFSRHLTM